MTHRIQIGFQTAHPRRRGEFWRTALGYVAEPPPKGDNSWELFAAESGIGLSDTDIDSATDPEGRSPRFLFERVDNVTLGNAFASRHQCDPTQRPPAIARAPSTGRPKNSEDLELQPSGLSALPTGIGSR
jgi:hypothetical protein